MDKLTLYIMMENDAFELSAYPINEESEAMYFTLMSLFGSFEEQTLSVEPLQMATVELKKNVCDYVEVFSGAFPILNKLKAKFNKVTDNSYFLVMPSAPNSTDEKIRWEFWLKAANEASQQSEIEEIFNKKIEVLTSTFGDFLEIYDFHNIRNDRKTYIGEANKSLRVCRFCKKSEKDGVTFRKIAHAISEALGNKNIILRDECDSCNEYFGSEIEQSLIEHLDIYRVFIGVKGKNGAPKIKYKNGEMFNDNGLAIVKSQHIDEKEGKSLHVELDSHKKYTPIKIYKALCKIALSVIDESELESLKGTIDWIRWNKHSSSTVPNVAVNIIHSEFSQAPQISVYVRQKNNIELPHVVGEFRLGSFVYVFILPFSGDDDIKFTNQKEYDVFWSKFNQYNKLPGWSFNDLNSDKEVKIKEKINIVHNNEDA